MIKQDWIDRNHKYTLIDGQSGFTLNVSGMHFTDNDIESMADRFMEVHHEMSRIEAGEIKNPDENRQVTHFTDRSMYPGTKIFSDVKSFAEDVRTGKVTGSTGKKFDSLIVNGIGGSALGPQLAQFAINGPYWNEMSPEKRNGNLKIYFVDNTDSAGVNDILNVVDLETAIVLSVSKSGGTQETRNNMIAFKNAFKDRGLDFVKHACAITMNDSTLDKLSRSEKWLKTFEMAESIGGRTSETNIVGHVPAALTGIDFDSFLEGACHMDAWTRRADPRKNPAYMLATMWYIAGKGKGDRNMVIVPYSDRLILLSRYLQQLVMESLGKEKNLDGKLVHQGLNVFGNKGGTDAHAFIQQLNDGRNDFFITFIEVWKDVLNIPVSDKGVTMGDYLHAFQSGLSAALRNNDRQVIQIGVREVNEFNLGMIIALYERTVAAYAELIHINAFHQPGVQSYKLASKGIIKLMTKIREKLPEIADIEDTAPKIAAKLGMEKEEVEVTSTLAKFAENGQREFAGFSISREWNKDRGWVYIIRKS